MLVPNFVHAKFVDQQGNLSIQWELFIDQLTSELQTNLSNEGFVIPKQNTLDRGIIQDKALVGTLLYDDEADNLFVLQNNGQFTQLLAQGEAIENVEGTPNEITAATTTILAAQVVTIALANNPIVPGTGAITVPQGTTAQRITRVNGMRYNTDDNVYELYYPTVPGWRTIDVSGGSVTGVFGTSGQIIVTPSSPAPVVSIDPVYVGQTSLTTLGTIATGTWNATTIGVPYGGTGQTTYTDGQLLIGNTTGNTLNKATLTPGTGVTITNGAGTITISATGTGGTVTSISAGANIVLTPSPIISAGTVALATTITGTTWNGTIIDPTYGGTGVNNGSNTLTLGGNLTTSGAFASTFTMTNTTSVTFPTSGTLATTSQLPVPAALTAGNDTNVTLTLGGTPATALLQAASITAGWTGVLSSARGGTGINNGSSTITLGGNLTTSGAFASTFTMTNTTSITFPTSGTLATTSQLPTPAALTKTDDTNVTLTLGGTPATALLQAASITAGWTGTLSPARGGTGVNNSTHTLTIGANSTINQDVSTAGSPTFTGLNLSGLTASQAVVTDGSKNLTSLAYGTASTASSLVERDASQNIACAGVTSTIFSVNKIINYTAGGLPISSGTFTYNGGTLMLICSGSLFLNSGSNVAGMTVFIRNSADTTNLVTLGVVEIFFNNSGVHLAIIPRTFFIAPGTLTVSTSYRVRLEIVGTNASSNASDFFDVAMINLPF